MRQCVLFMLAIVGTVAVRAQRYSIFPVPGSPHGISTIMQDSKSSLWLGTSDDVYCFDGERFYSLRPFGFPKESPISFAEDIGGGIWIATDSIDAKDGIPRGGLYRYYNGRVERVFSGGVESVVSVGGDTIIAIVSRTLPWEFGDLYIFRKSRAGWQGTPVLLDDAKWLSVDHQGAVLFPCRKGWCELSGNQIARWPKEKLQPQVQGSTGQANTMRVLRDKFHCVWFRSAREESYQCPGGPPVKLPDTVVGPDLAVQLSEAPDGSILSAGTNILFGRPGEMRVAGVENGLLGKVSASLAADDGTIFLSCDGVLFRWGYPFRLEYWNENDGVDSPNLVTRIGSDVYLSQAGISVLDATRRRWIPWVSRTQVGNVKMMIPGPASTLYAVSQVRGVTQLSKAGRVISKSDQRLDGATLARTNDGNYWFGGNGIRKIIQEVPQLKLTSQGLDDGRAEDFAYDKQRSLLWSCYSHEVVVLANGQWTHVTRKEGIVDDDCRSLALLPNGDVWVGYANNARVSRIRRAESGNVQVDTLELNGRGLPGGTAFLRSDTRNWLWRASYRDLYVAKLEAAAEDHWLTVFINSEVPFGGSEPNTGSSDEDGSIWYAVSNSVIHFSPPDDFADHFPTPAVFIAGMTTDSEAPILAAAVSRVPNRANITAHVGSLQFDRRNALHFRYRLLPLQSEWAETNSFDIALGKPRWGHHTLQVQAQLATGPWSPIVEQTFTVEWPVWLSWPMLLLYGMTGTGIGAGAVRLKKRRKFERNLLLPDLSAWRMRALSPETETLIGTRVDGRYEIGHVLSVGGFATVVRARDLHNDGQLCAVKVFRYEFGDRAWIRHRFDQEISALEQLSHPNIVRITGHGAIDTGAPYLVMEFIHGQTLREHLDNGALPHRQVAVFLRQIANALHSLHERAIYHRDLKPENLMVRSGAEGLPEVVLIDFSIAIVKSRDQTFHGISRVAGTLEYMAPEQVIGFADASTDIYALAKIVLEMLTGSRWSDLFSEAALDLPEQIRQYFKNNAVILRADSIDHIVSAMAFDPVGRPKDVVEFVRPIARDLEQSA